VTILAVLDFLRNAHPSVSVCLLMSFIDGSYDPLLGWASVGTKGNNERVVELKSNRREMHGETAWSAGGYVTPPSQSWHVIYLVPAVTSKTFIPS